MLRLKLLATTAGLLLATAANAQVDIPAFGARLSGFQETPSIFSPGTGWFEGMIEGGTLKYSLSYSRLSSAVTVAHIHFAKDRVAGGVLVFLCGGGGKPNCPQEGPVTGTITANDVMAIDPQGVPANAFDALVAAIVSDSAYVNVHTQAHPEGEIRGQIKF
jgi:hypothetical protein